MPVVGITGTGGAGKSTVTDELLARFCQHFPELRDRGARGRPDPAPHRRRAARRPDPDEQPAPRARLHALDGDPPPEPRDQRRCSRDAVAFLRAAGFDLVIVETAGIGQSDSEIVDLVDVPVYVMTSEFGAASQLEKIDMLDLAELVVINKFDKRGAEDALRDVRKQWRRNHVAFELRRRRDARSTRRSPASSTTPGVTGCFVDALPRMLGERPGRAPSAGTRRLTGDAASRSATR